MEVKLQTIEELESTKFEVSSLYAVGEDSCPFCGVMLSNKNDNDVIECLNPNCPYATQEAVRDVVEALMDSNGLDQFEAAEIAAKYTAEFDEDLEPVAKHRFYVTDMSSADWVLKKLAELETQLSNINAMVDNEIESIEAKRLKLVKPIENQIEFFKLAFEEHLQSWAFDELNGRKSKSINLLHGKVGFRKTPDQLLINDEERAIEIAEDNSFDVIRIKKEIKKADFKKLLISDEKAESIFANVAEVVEGENKFYIKPESPVV